MSFEAIIAWLGVKKAAVIGGAFGAAVSLILLKDLNTWWKRVTALGAGWAGAAFATPFLLELFMDADKAEKHLAGAGFLVGLLFLSVAYNFYLAFPQWMEAGRKIIEKRFGGTS